MRTGAGKGQDKDVILLVVGKKPIGRNVALPVAGIVAAKRMVVILLVQLAAGGEDGL